jgi:segregation and condensation protein B
LHRFFDMTPSRRSPSRHEPDASLEQLSAAFAEMLGPRDAPDAKAATDEAADEPQISAFDLPEAETESDDDVYCPINSRTILEAVLFVGRPDNSPLTSEEIAAVMRGVRPGEIDQLVEQLNDKYDAARRPYRILSEGPGYRLALRAEYDAVREKFAGRLREARLSQAAIDVLSIVAYHPGVTAEEVTRLRGKPSGPILTQLVRRQLLRIERPEGKARPLQYHTTDRFLELFNLAGLGELPQQEDVD